MQDQTAVTEASATFSNRLASVLISLLPLMWLAGCSLASSGSQPAASVNVSVTPSSVSMQPGKTQQFAATVTGTTNTSVSWSASGGTVSSSGFYTAPATAGTYSVNATSVADTTQSASAKVTVNAPSQHSVTLSWTASTSTVSGYNVYRATVPGGPYLQINSSLNPSTNYVDDSVQSGQTYYYVATAVNFTGVESTYSDQVTANIPTP